MPTDWNAVNANCPFYRSEDSHTITCEGLIGSAITHRFNRKEDKSYHVSRRCNSVKNCRKCPVYSSLINAKYPESA